MQITVKRTKLGNTFSSGELHIDGKFFCYTIEDEVREIKGKPVSEWKIAGVTAIPAGTYELVLSESNRFKRLLPEIKNVPGYTGVRIHRGNSSKHTEGCLIVGYTKTEGDWLGNSTKAEIDLIAALRKATGKIMIEIG